MFRLRTVRHKLTALVALSLVVIAAAVFALHWVLQQQLTHESATRVEAAEDAFEDEVEEQTGDLDIVAHVLGSSTGVRDAVHQGDVAKVQRIAKRFFDAYPNMDMLFVDANGKIVTQLGCEDPPDTISAVDVSSTRWSKAFSRIRMFCPFIDLASEREGPG